MVRPKLKIYAKIAIRGTNIPMAVALADMESQTIEYLQQIYVMGDRAYPLHFLFGDKNGYIKHFANNYARKTRKFEATHFLERGDRKRDDGYGDPQWDAREEPDEEETETTRRAREVVDDGLTLTLSEYRVMKFCMSNASDAKRPLNGLHIYIARAMGCSRARVTKVFADCRKKLISEVL